MTNYAATNTGSLGVEVLDKLVKGRAKQNARVIDTNLNKAPAGLLKAFPVDRLDSQMLETWTVKGNPGQINQALDGMPDLTKHKYVRSYKDMTNSWDKQAYKIMDSAQTAMAVNRLANDGRKFIQDYFTNARVWKLLTELKAKEVTGNTHAADDVWGASGTGDAESDVAKAITKIVSTTGLDIETGGYQFGLAYPSEVLDEFKQLDLINQVTQQLGVYLKDAWKLNLYPITPPTDADGNAYIDVKYQTSSDILTTSALVFVEGQQTMIGGNYAPSDIMLNETERQLAEGWTTVMKQCCEYLVVPTDGTANGKSALIYEITSVTT
ncbi:MAG: hypothetical protein WC124_01940 [Desulfoplanes sp.]